MIKVFWQCESIEIEMMEGKKKKERMRRLPSLHNRSKKISDRHADRHFSFCPLGFEKRNLFLHPTATGKDELFPLFTCTVALLMW